MLPKSHTQTPMIHNSHHVYECVFVYVRIGSASIYLTKVIIPVSTLQSCSLWSKFSLVFGYVSASVGAQRYKNSSGLRRRLLMKWCRTHNRQLINVLLSYEQQQSKHLSLWELTFQPWHYQIALFNLDVWTDAGQWRLSHFAAASLQSHTLLQSKQSPVCTKRHFYGV